MLLLFFLVLFPVDMVVVKPVILLAALLFMRRDISVKALLEVPPFYLLIPLAELLKFVLLQRDFGKPHFISFSIGMIYWVMSALAFLFLALRIRTSDARRTEQTLELYFIINAAWSFGNLARVMVVSHSLNPYALSSEMYGNSTGDFIKGLLMGPSYLNMLVNAFFTIYFLFKGRWVLSVVAAWIAWLTSSNFANLLFLPLLIVCFFILRPKQAKMAIAAQLLLFGGFYLLLSLGNLSYVKTSLSAPVSTAGVVPGDSARKFSPFDSLVQKPFGKVVSWKETGHYLAQDARHLAFGAGIGNFSSQLAVRTSDLVQGKKSRLFRLVPQYIHPDFYLNHYQIYKAVYDMPPGYHSIRHLPNSTINQVAGEYGVTGVLFFLLFYLGYIFRRWRSLTYAKFLLPLLLWFMVFDYLFEYLSVVVFFELFFLADIAAGKARTVHEQ